MVRMIQRNSDRGRQITHGSACDLDSPTTACGSWDLETSAVFDIRDCLELQES